MGERVGGGIFGRGYGIGGWWIGRLGGGEGEVFSRKGRKERKGNGKGVVWLKSLYNRFVDFVFFVVKKDWKTAKDAKRVVEGRGKREDHSLLSCIDNS